MGAITGLFMIILSLIYTFSTFIVIFTREGRLLVFEACLLFAFVIMAYIITKGIFNKKNWAWTLSSYTFGIMFANAGYLYFKTDIPFWYSLMFISAVIGFIYSIMRIKSYEQFEYDKFKSKLKRGVLSDEVIVEEIKPLKEDEILPSYEKEIAKSEVKTRFTPGKFVASKTATTYHDPKCDWAKRIKPKNQVWFESAAKARKAGYKKHNCK